MSALGNKVVFSENLKYYIEKSGKDRRELAEIWGFPYSTVTEWVNGRKYPRIDKIEKIANYFGIAKADLIEEMKEQPLISKELSETKKAMHEFVDTLSEEQAQQLLQIAHTVFRQ